MTTNVTRTTTLRVLARRFCLLSSSSPSWPVCFLLVTCVLFHHNLASRGGLKVLQLEGGRLAVRGVMLDTLAVVA